MRVKRQRHIVAIGLLFTACANDPDERAEPQDGAVEASSVDSGDASSSSFADGGGTAMDASPLTAADANGAVTADAGGQRDAGGDATAQTVIDAAGIKSPSVAEVARILSRRCGDCHQNEGPDGFVFDGHLRSTLLASVEAAATPQGELPGAADCRLEKRVLRGDANSYLIRKFELGLGRTPQPRVCGQGMPRDLILEPQDYLDMAVELEQLKLWILAGAPLQ